MNSLSKNSFLNFFSQIILFSSSLVLSILLARMLGPAQMGKYSYWMWLVGTGSLILTLGIPRAVTRYISQFQVEGDLKVKQLISRTFIFEIKILVIFSALLLISSFFVGENNRFSYLIVVFTLPVVVLNNLFGSYLQGLQKYNLLLRISMILSPVTFVISLIILFFFRNLNNLLLLNLLTTLISFSIALFYLQKYFDFKIEKLSKPVYADILKYTFLTSLIILLDVVLMERSEIFFLKMFSNFEEVAFYSISFGLVNRVMILIPGAITGVIMPRVAQLFGENNLESISMTYFSSTRYLSFITVPIIFAGIVLIDLPISILYGQSYYSVIPVIKILLISGGLSAIVAAASSVLYGIGKQDFILKLGIVAVVVNILMDLLLIPNMGAIGAALANATAQVFGVIAGTYYTAHIKKMKFPWMEFLKLSGVGAMSAVLVYIIRQFLILDFGVILLVVLSLLFMIFYLLGLAFLKFYIQKDFDILEKIIYKIPFMKDELLGVNKFLSKRFAYGQES